MTGPEHHKEAEDLLGEVTCDDGTVNFGDGAKAVIAAAQVHATLALAAATVLAPAYQDGYALFDNSEWLATVQRGRFK